MVLRLALAQILAAGYPAHAAIATALPLVDGGPRRLVHGVLGALLRAEAKLPELPSLPEAVMMRWHPAGRRNDCRGASRARRATTA